MGYKGRLSPSDNYSCSYIKEGKSILKENLRIGNQSMENLMPAPKNDNNSQNGTQGSKISQTRKYSLNNLSSIALTPFNAKKREKDEEEEVKPSGIPKAEGKTSPKQSVRQRKAKLEEKCRQARALKEQTRSTNQTKKQGKSNQRECEEKYSLKDFMDELHDRFNTQEKKLDKNQRKLDTLGAKIEKIEEKTTKSDKNNKEELAKICNEIITGISELEEKVTEKVVAHQKPKISEIQEKTKDDIAKAVQKEIKSVDIPLLIHGEVKAAMEMMKKKE